MDDEEIKRKFKVGDKVKIVTAKELYKRNHIEWGDEYTYLHGLTATITDTRGEDDDMYKININNIDMHESELILIEQQKPIKPAKYDIKKGWKF